MKKTELNWLTKKKTLLAMPLPLILMRKWKFFFSFIYNKRFPLHCMIHNYIASTYQCSWCFVAFYWAQQSAETEGHKLKSLTPWFFHFGCIIIFKSNLQGQSSSHFKKKYCWRLINSVLSLYQISQSRTKGYKYNF